MHITKVIERAILSLSLVLAISFGVEVMQIGQIAYGQASGIHNGRTVQGCFDGASNNCFVNYTNGSNKDFYQTSCSALTGCNTDSSVGSDVHGGRAIKGCFPGNSGNCFVNYNDGSYQDFTGSSCPAVSGCASSSGSTGGSGVHNGKTVASCFVGGSGNCFVNYSDGSFKDFYQTSCPAVTGCDGSSDSGSGGNEHDGRTVQSCFVGGSSNCFVNYTNGTFKDFYQSSCSALSGCGNSSSGDSSGGTSSGGGSSDGTTSSNGFAPSLFRNYTASDCSYIVYPGNSFLTTLANARPGQKICLKGGTHQGGLYINDVTGTANNFITLMSYPGETATIVASGDATHGINLLKNVSYFEIFDLDIRGASGTSGYPIPTYQGFPSGILGGDTNGTVHHIKVVNNRIRNFAGGGINLYYLSHADIQGNVVYNTARWSMNMESGISIYKPVNNGHAQNNWNDSQGRGYSVLIRHNIVYNNENRAAVATTISGVTSNRVSDGNCIVLDSYQQSGYSGRSLLTQNVCYNNGANGLHVFQTSNTTVRNNTSIYSGKTWWDSGNNGNILLWGATGEISNTGESRNNVIENNLVWAEPYTSNAWNLRVEAGPPLVSGSGYSSMTQSISVLNTQIRNNLFVVSGNQSAPFLPTNNGNQIVNNNPGLVSSPSKYGTGQDFRIRSGSIAGQRNIGATYFKN